jgi:hypothetical protein
MRDTAVERICYCRELPLAFVAITGNRKVKLAL